MAAHENIVSLNAKEEAYGSRLTKAGVARTIGTYELGVAVFCVALYGPKNIIPIVAWLLVTAFYVYRRILVWGVLANYRRRAEGERNRFINIVTQGMTTEGAQILPVLRNTIGKVNGEFREDLETLLANIVSTSDKSIQHAAFQDLEKKYQDDIYFCLFMEQVETTVNESIYHIETFDTFKDSHNRLLLKQKEFIRKKKQALGTMYLMLCVSLFTVVMCCYSQGYASFMKVYATSAAGMACSTVYLLILGVIVNNFYKHYFDDEITRY